MKAQRGRTGNLLMALFSALVVLALSATLAAAHNTTVTKSDPADGAVLAKAPAQVMAQYSEELDTKQSTMKVMDAGGKQVSDGNGKVDLNDPDHKTMLATISSALPDGDYTVAWHALLTDGDATDGSWKFTVKAATAVQAATVAPTAAAAFEATPVHTVTVVSAAAPTQPAATVVPANLPSTGESRSNPLGWLAAGIAVVVIGLRLNTARRQA